MPPMMSFNKEEEQLRHATAHEGSGAKTKNRVHEAPLITAPSRPLMQPVLAADSPAPVSPSPGFGIWYLATS